MMINAGWYNTIGETGRGTFSRIIEGKIGWREQQQIAKALESQTKTKIIYNSKAARKDGNHFNGDENTIHLKNSAKNMRRGLFYEEVQHALDEQTGAYGILRSHIPSQNRALHAITARNIVQNPILPTTTEQNSRLLRLADQWQ
jgi:hypothetical protein